MALGGTVVTAHPGLARHWQWRCNEAAVRAGKQAWPTPDILPLRAWIERLWEQSLLAGGTAGRLNLLSVRQSRLVGENQWHESSPAVLPGGRGSPSGRVMQGWQLCREWGIATRELIATAASVDERLFAEWTDRYESCLAEQGWIDPWSVHRLVREDLAAGVLRRPGPVRFIGFHPVTPQLQRMAQVLESLDRFAGWGFSATAGQAVNARRVECTDSADERRRIAAWVRHRRERDPRALIGIVLPEITRHGADLRRELLDTLAPGWCFDAAGPTAVSAVGATCLADTGLVHSALIALRLPGGTLDYRDFGQLLRSPYLRGADTEANARAALDIRCRERNYHEIDLRALVAAHSTAAVPDMTAIIRTGLGLLDTSTERRERREPADWVGFIDRYLRTIGWGKGRALAYDEGKTIDAWQSLLEQFATLNAFIGRIGYHHAVGLLAALAREQQDWDRAGADAVQILSVADADGYRFDDLWCAGLTSEAWPPMPRSTPLIAAHLQRARGIPQANPVACRQVADERLKRLLAAAPNTLASWAGQGDGTVLARSPVLESMPAATGEQAPAAGCGAGGPGAAAIELVHDDPAPPVGAAAAIRGGSRVLNLQSNCPARAFFELRLGAKPLRIPPFGIDAAARGSIVHDALEDLYRRLQEFGGPQQCGATEISAAIPAAVTRALDRHVPRSHPLSKALRDNEFEHLLRLLGEVVAGDRQRPPFTVTGLEVEHTAHIGALQLNLRIDRIDELEPGKKLIIDYKTGQAFSIDKWRGERPAEPQLPLYAVTGDGNTVAIALMKIDDKVTLTGVGANDLDSEIDGIIGPETFGGDDWREVIAAWGYRLDRLAAEFMAGDVRIDKHNDSAAHAELAMLTRIHSPAANRSEAE